MYSDIPKKYNIVIKDGTSFSLLNTKGSTIEYLIDELLDNGVQYQQTSGNIKWYPPHEIEQVYFDFDK